jgi:hypothetical protein
MTVKTTFAGRNPFAKKLAAEDLVVCKDPLPDTRFFSRYKYDSVFEKMKPGECIRCPGENAGSVSAALRQYVKRKGIEAKVKSTDSYPAKKGEPTGRVWMV